MTINKTTLPLDTLQALTWLKKREQSYFETFVIGESAPDKHVCGLNQTVYEKFITVEHEFAPTYIMHHGLKLISAMRSSAQFEQNVVRLVEKDKSLLFQLNKQLGLPQAQMPQAAARLKKDIILIGLPKYIVTLIFSMYQQYIKHQIHVPQQISDLGLSWNRHILNAMLVKKQSYSEQSLKNLLFNFELGATLIRLSNNYKDYFEEVKTSVLQRLFFIKNVKKYEIIKSVTLQELLLLQAVIQRFSLIDQTSFPKYLVPGYKKNTFQTNTLGALFIMQSTFSNTVPRDLVNLSHKLLNEFVSEESVFMPLRGMINTEVAAYCPRY